ncbi:MAG TPA: type 4a pilus biogenesis protein PilO [Acidimicrobiia bacterium]
MRNRVVLASVLGLIVVLLLWNFAFFSPAGKDRSKAENRLATAKSTGSGLQQQLQTLEGINAQQPAEKAHLQHLNALVPPTADLEGFIRSSVDLEQEAGVDWVSVEPSLPSAGANATEIKMQIVISGGFFQVLDYLNRLELLDRLVVVDSIDVTTGAANTSSSGGSTSATTPTTEASSSGAPLLTVTLNARMFTQAQPTTGGTGSTGSTGATGSSGTSTPTTTAATTPTTGIG